MKKTGVRGFIRAAACPGGSEMEGRTYLVTAWFRYDSTDALKIKADLDAVLALYDQRILPPAVRMAENLAETIGKRLTNCLAVDVDRPEAGIFARWENARVRV